MFLSMQHDEQPPPYSAVVAQSGLFDSPQAPLPFSHSDQLILTIQSLVSEGKTLCSRFKDVCDVASACAKFEYEVPVFGLSQRFETLVWESRSVAGVVFVALKDFNEIILDFLSEPNASVQDRIKELTNASELLQRERDSTANHKSSFDAFFKELEDFHRMIRSEFGALVPIRRRQSRLEGRGTKSTRLPRSLRPPHPVPRPEPLNGLSIVTASLGAISRTCMDYALRFERIAEEAVLSSCGGHPLNAQQAGPAAPTTNSDTTENTDLCPPTPIGNAELPNLIDLVDTLVCDMRAFTSQDVFSTVLAELAREQTILFVYLKDKQSIANKPYRFEIKRLRKQLPSVCSALDAYSKARVS